MDYKSVGAKVRWLAGAWTWGAAAVTLVSDSTSITIDDRQSVLR